MVDLYENIAVFVIDSLSSKSARNSFLKGLDFFFTVRKFGDPHARNFIPVRRAVHFSDDQFLRNVDKTSCEVTRVSRTESRVGQTLAGTVC